MAGPEVAWTLPAVPSSVGELRRRASAFASAAGVPGAVVEDVALVVSETVTNAVMHAYAGRDPGRVSLRCAVVDGRLVIEVSDEGSGVEARPDSPGMGHGLSVVGALVQTLDVAPGPGGSGTVVTMSFAAEVVAPDPPAYEPLCALALEHLADVSCVDVVSGGVLRRAAAEVAGDPSLTAWMRGALPPAKPGTATWEALRKGGAHLVVHDPSVPRSPGGTGERLGLAWWVSVPLEGPDGRPIALWGLGGRMGGRPVPSEAVIGSLVAATRRPGFLAAPVWKDPQRCGS